MEQKILELLAQIGGFYPGTLADCSDSFARAYQEDPQTVEDLMNGLLARDIIVLDGQGVRLSETYSAEMKRFRKVKKHRG